MLEPIMTKTLRKAIMTRSRLQRKLFSSKTQTNERLYKKPKKIVSRLYKKERLKFYKSIDPKIVTDNKKFWHNMKPYFNEKGSRTKKITLVEPNGEIISDDDKVAETLNEHFKNAVPSLNFSDNADLLTPVSDDIVDPIEIIIEEFKIIPVS